MYHFFNIKALFILTTERICRFRAIFRKKAAIISINSTYRLASAGEMNMFSEMGTELFNMIYINCMLQGVKNAQL
jgi:hypothetical protein